MSKEIDVDKLEHLNTDEKIVVLIEVVRELSGQIGELVDQQKELIEKLSNLSLPGGDYDTDSFDS